MYEQTRETEVGVRDKILKTAQKSKASFRRDYDERTADGLSKAEQLKRNELAYNMSMVRSHNNSCALTQSEGGLWSSQKDW